MAAGDSLITSPIACYEEEAFTGLMRLMHAGDVGFTNLETLIHEYDVPPVNKPTAVYMASHPRMLEELKWLGINLASSANNHAYDYGQLGLLTSLGHLERSGIVHAGAGRNLNEARAARYLETPKGRVALLAVTSTFPEGALAMEQRPDAMGGPGISPLRHSTSYTVDAPAFAQLQRLNRAFEGKQEDRRPFEPDPKMDERGAEVRFLKNRFFLGDTFLRRTAPNPVDLEANLKAIREARELADWVLVSVHSHEAGATPEEPPEFLCAFARAAIDAGADAIIGHGAHSTKGIEVYRGKPIFYGMSVFIRQLAVARPPAASYEAAGLGHQSTPGEFYKAIEARLPQSPEYWGSVIARVEYHGRNLKAIHLHPIDLGQGQPLSRRGRPFVAKGEVAQQVLARLQRLSQPFGTPITVKDGVGIVSL